MPEADLPPPDLSQPDLLPPDLSQSDLSQPDLSPKFTDRSGHHEAWRYAVGLLMILAAWLVLGSALAGVVLTAIVRLQGAEFIDLATALSQLARSAPVLTYAITCLPFLCLLGGIWLTMRHWHQAAPQLLISRDRQINRSLLVQSFALWFLLQAGTQAIDYWLHPQDYQFTFLPAQWFWLLPIALVLTPLQTTAEELLFRGYLLQGLRQKLRSRLGLIGITAALFALPHFGNPEMQRGALWLGLIYLALGAFLGWMTLQADRLEPALGVHAANNLFVVLVANTQDSALPTPALWTLQTAGDPRWALLLALLQIGLFSLIFFGLRSNRSLKIYL